MNTVLVAPAAALVVLTLVAFGLRLQSRSQRRLVGRRVGASPGAPQILAFTGASCTVCHVAQRPALERLRAVLSDLDVTEIDVERQPQTARAYRVMTLPTTVVLDADGKISAVNAGFASETLLRTQVAAARTASVEERGSIRR